MIYKITLIDGAIHLNDSLVSLVEMPVNPILPIDNIKRGKYKIRLSKMVNMWHILDIAQGEIIYVNEEGVLHNEKEYSLRFALSKRLNKYWYENGILHKLDGPAYIDIDNMALGLKMPLNYGMHWYYENELMSCNSQEDFERILKMKSFW
jgi:hypothetical protein